MRLTLKPFTSGILPHITGLLCIVLLLSVGALASAQDAPAPNPEEGITEPPVDDDTWEETDEPAPETAEEPGTAGAELSVSTDDLVVGGADGLFLLAGKLGGIVSFNGLDPFVHVGLEIGYVFPVMNHGIGAFLQVEYTAPSASGKYQETQFEDPTRVVDGTFNWELDQQELVFQPTFLYRLTSFSSAAVPYVGLGFRLYLLASTTRGTAGGESFDETTEQSTKWGLGVPIGVEFVLGPGGIIAEFLIQWGPFDHKLTGETNLGGASLLVGYRLLL